MKNQFRLYRRPKGGFFYAHDSVTGKQDSLGTRDRAEAVTLLNARNESVRQPQLNLQIAKAYLAGTDSGVSTRTWQNALDAVVATKRGSTQDRWRRAAKEKALDLIRDRVIIETQAEQLLACLKAGTVSTNVHLRKLHNFCLSMNWLPWPLIPRRLWPEVRFQPNHINAYLERAREIIGDRSQGEIDYDNAVVAHLSTGMDIKRAIAAANERHPKEALRPGPDDWADLAARYHYIKEHQAILKRLGMSE